MLEMFLESLVALHFLYMSSGVRCLTFLDFTANLIMSEAILAKPFPKQFGKRRNTELRLKLVSSHTTCNHLINKSAHPLLLRYL